jgi:predicted Fe-Mo cluster-binding NifX family protein
VHIAIPVWNGRVSPVFESVRTLVVLEVEDGRQKGRTEVHLTDPAPHVRVRRLVDRDVDVLVCGAISRPVAEMCAEAGITVIPWVSGDFERVVEAFLAGSLPNPDLTMPGCCCRRLRARRRNRHPGSGGGNGRRRG